MSVVGYPNDWIELLEQTLPELLGLIADTWDELTRPFTDNREDAITELLCRALKRNRTVRDLPFYVQIQMVELDPAAGQELGRMDIAFLPTGCVGAPNESIYFCLECKRLNVIKTGTTRRGGSDYVLHGMLRFVNGQYASAVRHGGMLGYVLDGDTPRAIANVERNVRRNCAVLAMDPPGRLIASSIAPAALTARESLHRRPAPPTPFQIHHLFVDGR